ncbi:bis(5'-nucleosyl)-tetraphosphatase [Candidatus Nitrosotalea okcheonensis]|uniref:Bis(5'-nucleosyl)-tetraphosphatase [asymmetrical] n=1 Tax=Candidatus Nitrosotalea okcheonensis TaxID=1903276 RepID=A0A2H1FFV5_9ARCH|nr:NUDIX domain-containing protein [Candidatus Nitrosotalea okcheonensis]MDE1728190.1 NUDIX domain-containing protein [Nitrososphaerota archaeon]MDE1832347.1 NUDIX domain-containing protein [Nitrososphaerota archaeon]MDE1840761.1 NUDIX domain-containing protein [Nitrososphaerota archaeon]MDE1878074.1 NUDIX domain-containing protein [Nitrososphaerota archaeon]SMH71643.1 NUDIX hydrolase [Candidatus Nitrosotalea okcheonensis]
MLEERSAGTVIYRQSPQGKLYLLLNYPSGHWDFVKGNIEKGETFKQTVLREIREETGIEDITFVDGFEDKVEYHYQRDGQVIHKEVIFFLANTKTSKVVLSHEHRDYTWLNFNDALEKLTYKTAQNIFKKIKDL